MKTVAKKLIHFFGAVLVFVVVLIWIFSGWPKIGNFPSKIEKAQAATVATPVITLAAGSYTDVQTTTITDSTTGATICYTTDGSTPGASSSGTCNSSPTQTYSSAITIDRNMTIKAIGTKKNATNSAVASSAYTININTPTFGTNGGSFNNDASSTILDSFMGATICYTTDGSTPGATTPGTCNGSPTQTYSTAVSVTSTGTVIKALATKSGVTNSAVATSNTFTLTVGAISSSPGAGTYPGTQSVSLNIATTTGATAHYTTDGSAVSCSSTSYTGAFNVAATTTVKAIGCKTNYTSDSAISDLYTITAPAAPTNVQASRNYGDKVRVTWTKSAGATTYYVYRNGLNMTPSGTGDVALYDDTSADAPVINPGIAIASQNLSSFVSLQAGVSWNNGTTYVYEVVAANAIGNSLYSATSNGYRSVVNVAYQWQRSAGDSDENYSDLEVIGSTSDMCNDFTAPADGSGRYYRFRVSADGMPAEFSVSARGHLGIISITMESGSGTVSYGLVTASMDTTSSGVNQTQTFRNTGNVTEDFDIKGQHSANWILSASGPGDGIYKHEWCTTTCDTTPVWNAMFTSYGGMENFWATDVPIDATRDLDLKVTVPSSNAGNDQQRVDVFIQATAHF